MTGIVYSILSHLLIVNILIFVYCFYVGKWRTNYILIFNLLYLGFSIFTFLPLHVEDLRNLISSKWNWEGKLISIIFLFLLLPFIKNKKSVFLPKNFEINKRYVFLVLWFSLVFHSWTLLFIDISNVNFDTFWFQLLMPSISEELLFRGMLLGLIVNYIFKDCKADWFSILLTALLFGLSHSFSVTDDFIFNLRCDELFNTSLPGIFWAWITLRSKTIMYSMFSHSMGNIPICFMG